MSFFPGFGALSKHVLNLPNVRQVIAIEDAQACSQQLHVSSYRFVNHRYWKLPDSPYRLGTGFH